MFPWNCAKNISSNILEHTRSRPSPCRAIEGFTLFRTAPMNQRYVNGVDVVVRRNGVHKCCPKPIWERNNTCLTVIVAIGPTVITQQIMTEHSSGFNSIGFVASDQVKTIELSCSSSVLHLETRQPVDSPPL